MNCEQARQLFDAYLDGELNESLATELGAHRIKCSDCRRHLALMEVSGHIVASDSGLIQMDEGFTDRLIACVDESPMGRPAWWYRNWRMTTGGLAAAAALTLVVLGVFGHRETRVAGEKNVLIERPHAGADSSPLLEGMPPFPGAADRDRASGEWLDRARKNIEAKRKSAASLQKALDLTANEWIDALEAANDLESTENPAGEANDVSSSQPPQEDPNHPQR